jgi:hypothetical protein
MDPKTADLVVGILSVVGVIIAIAFVYALIRAAVRGGMKDVQRDREKKGRRL